MRKPKLITVLPQVLHCRMNDGHWSGCCAGSFSDERKEIGSTDQDHFPDWSQASVLLIKVESMEGSYSLEENKV